MRETSNVLHTSCMKQLTHLIYKIHLKEIKMLKILKNALCVRCELHDTVDYKKHSVFHNTFMENLRRQQQRRVRRSLWKVLDQALQQNNVL